MFVVNYNSERLKQVLNKDKIMTLGSAVQVGVDTDLPNSNLIRKISSSLRPEFVNTTIGLPNVYMAFDHFYRSWLTTCAANNKIETAKIAGAELTQEFLNKNWPNLDEELVMPLIIATYQAPYRNWLTDFTLDDYDEEDEMRSMALVASPISPSEYTEKGIPIGCCLTQTRDMKLKVLVVKIEAPQPASEVDDMSLNLEDWFISNAKVKLELVETTKSVGLYRLGLVSDRTTINDGLNLGGCSVTDDFWTAPIKPMTGFGLGIEGSGTNSRVPMERQLNYFNSLFEPYTSVEALGIYVAPISAIIGRYLVHKLMRSIATSSKADAEEIVSKCFEVISNEDKTVKDGLLQFLARDTTSEQLREYLERKHTSYIRPLLSLFGLQNTSWVQLIGIEADKDFRWPKYHEELAQVSEERLFGTNPQEWLQVCLTGDKEMVSAEYFDPDDILRGKSLTFGPSTFVSDSSLRNLTIYIALMWLSRNQGV